MFEISISRICGLKEKPVAIKVRIEHFFKDNYSTAHATIGIFLWNIFKIFLLFGIQKNGL